jgi:hypothetical protein
MTYLDDMHKQYLETALWSSTSDDGTPLDENNTIDALSESFVNESLNDCKAFINKAGATLDNIDAGNVGHDFWLTRNGHGAGFCDGDYSDNIGKKLTSISDEFSETHLYVGDNGNIYHM